MSKLLPLIALVSAVYAQQSTVNINTASAEELAQVPGMSPAQVAAIIAYRTRQGPIDSVSELDQVPGFDPANIVTIMMYLNFSSSPQPAAISSPVISPTQVTLSVTDMLAVKNKIEEADRYTAANLHGIAFLTLLEAQQMAQGRFASELEPRISVAVRESKAVLDNYKVNITVVDRTNSGRAEYIQADLLAKYYTFGIQAVQTGGAYTLTLEINSVDIEENTSVMHQIVKIPTGTVKTMSGTYTARRDELNILCHDYFAKRDAATGSSLDTVVGGAAVYDAIGNKDVIGGIMGFARMSDASQRRDLRDQAGANCEQAMQNLENTPMFTQDVVTTPTPYDEITTKKTAIAGIRITFAGPRGPLYTTPPMDVEFYKKDFSRPNIPDVGIRGDPQEPISDREVRMGIFNEIGTLVHNQFNEGRGLWDAIALSEANKKTGQSALEAYVQLFFDGHTSEVRQQAKDYIIGHSKVTYSQLSGYQ